MELSAWNIMLLVSAGFVSWLVWGLVNALIIVGLKLDRLESRRIRILSMTLVSWLTYGLILAAALWLVDGETNVFAFIVHTLIGLWLGYTQAKDLPLSR